MAEVVTNKKFSEDGFFKACCEKAGIEPTMRQASKFRMEKGSAFKVRKQVVQNKDKKEKDKWKDFLGGYSEWKN